MLYPTYPAVMCVDRCDTKNPVWGLFREGHMAAMQYYDSSSFKWYMDGSVSRLRVEDTLPLHAECETSSIIDDLFTWLNMGPPEVHPPTIYVRPVASYKDVNQNFCFWGDNSGINVVTKAVVTAVISAAEVATMAIVDFGTGGAGIAADGFIHFGFGALQALASAGIDATYEWPNNPIITGGKLPGGVTIPGLPPAP